MAHAFTGASGVLFDCDGTLLNTMNIWNETEEQLISQATRPLTFEELNDIRSAPITEGAALFHEKHGVGSSSQDVLDFLDGALMGFYHTQAEALPGAAALLAALHDDGIPCAVITSSPLRYVEAGLRHAGIWEYFATVIATDEVGLSKRDPAIYLNTLATLGADPARAWGVDDALYAIRAMKKAGLQTVGAYECDETGTFEDLAATATRTVHSLEELL